MKQNKRYLGFRSFAFNYRFQDLTQAIRLDKVIFILCKILLIDNVNFFVIVSFSQNVQKLRFWSQFPCLHSWIKYFFK